MTTPTMRFEPEAAHTHFALTGLAPLSDRTVSVDLGYSSVTGQFLESDPPKAEELSAALSVVELHLDDVGRELNADRSPDDGRSPFEMTVRDGVVIGIGPIFANLAAIELGHDGEAVDGFVLTRDAVEDVFRTIATEALADRVHNPGLDPAWAASMVGGACVVVETFRCWDLQSITVLGSKVAGR